MGAQHGIHRVFAQLVVVAAMLATLVPAVAASAATPVALTGHLTGQLSGQSPQPVGVTSRQVVYDAERVILA